MTSDDTEIVSAVRATLAQRVGRDRFDLWFGDATRWALVGDALQVSVPSQLYQELMRSRFRSQIEASCRDTLGKSVAVTFHVDSQLHQAAQAEASAQTAPAETPVQRPAAPTLEGVPPSTAPGPSRRRFATLASFVVGASNRLAAAGAQSIVERPGQISPLVIHGPTGVGKTHLLEGIWGAAKARHARLHAVYLSAEQFTSYFIEALRGSGLPSFRRKYREVELLLIDDLQFFCGKKQTAIELLNTIDTLGREGRQLVFAADRAPPDLDGLGGELIARLSGGLVCRIDGPDYEMRLEIIRRQAARLELAIPADAMQWVAAHVNGNARELSGALHRLHATRRALRQPLTLALVQEALADAIGQAGKPVRLADIQRAVCHTFGVESEALRSARKGKNIADPRTLAMWLSRKYTRAALAEIGEFFGRRSHSTVISAQKKVEGWLHDNAQVQLADRTCSIDDAIRRVEEKLRAG